MATKKNRKIAQYISENKNKLLLIGTVGLSFVGTAAAAVGAYKYGLFKMSQELKDLVAYASDNQRRIDVLNRGKKFMLFPIEIPVNGRSDTAWRYFFDEGVKIKDLIKPDMISGFGEELSEDTVVDAIDFLKFKD